MSLKHVTLTKIFCERSNPANQWPAIWGLNEQDRTILIHLQL